MENTLYLQCGHCKKIRNMQLVAHVTDHIRKEERYTFTCPVCIIPQTKVIQHGKKVEPREEFGKDNVL